ncbi:MAG: hypothetical protein MGG11_09090 [Trichodesmium sp. MAG_R03]|nr:hypothetical protein [Trichodesmium sp. MAG_R03]
MNQQPNSYQEVKDVLERSVHNRAMIELGLVTRDDLVERPFRNIEISPQEYEALSSCLKLRGAICLLPLTSEQVNQYLQDLPKGNIHRALVP